MIYPGEIIIPTKFLIKKRESGSRYFSLKHMQKTTDRFNGLKFCTLKPNIAGQNYFCM